MASVQIYISDKTKPVVREAIKDVLQLLATVMAESETVGTPFHFEMTAKDHNLGPTKPCRVYDIKLYRSGFWANDERPEFIWSIGNGVHASDYELMDTCVQFTEACDVTGIMGNTDG